MLWTHSFILTYISRMIRWRLNWSKLINQTTSTFLLCDRWTNVYLMRWNNNRWGYFLRWLIVEFYFWRDCPWRFRRSIMSDRFYKGWRLESTCHGRIEGIGWFFHSRANSTRVDSIITLHHFSLILFIFLLLNTTFFECSFNSMYLTVSCILMILFISDILLIDSHLNCILLMLLLILGRTARDPLFNRLNIRHSIYFFLIRKIQYFLIKTNH